MNREQAIRAARKQYRADGESMQIDEDAVTAPADGGVWVQAWVWVEIDDHPVNMPRPGHMWTTDE